jgi:GNAT superfamily N-acetyltransferase
MYGELYKALGGFGLPFGLDMKGLSELLPVMLRSKLCCVIVAEDGEGVCAFLSGAVARIDRKYAYGTGLVGRVSDLYVAPGKRGSGLADSLLRAAEDWFRQSGAAIAECDVLTQNLPAGRFWDKRGYRDLSCLKYKILQE